MTRKDFENLASMFAPMIAGGEIGDAGFAYICATLERDYDNFNRAIFEKRVYKLAGRAVTTGGETV